MNSYFGPNALGITIADSAANRQKRAAVQHHERPFRIAQTRRYVQKSNCWKKKDAPFLCLGVDAAALARVLKSGSWFARLAAVETFVVRRALKSSVPHGQRMLRRAGLRQLLWASEGRSLGVVV
jgi:hypothetical protein